MIKASIVDELERMVIKDGVQEVRPAMAGWCARMVHAEDTELRTL